jgi:hypothetical protein
MSRHDLKQGPMGKESAKTEARRLALDTPLDTGSVGRVLNLNTVGDPI